MSALNTYAIAVSCIGPAADSLIVRVYICISVYDCVYSICNSESKMYTILYSVSE